MCGVIVLAIKTFFTYLFLYAKRVGHVTDVTVRLLLQSHETIHPRRKDAHGMASVGSPLQNW